MKTYVLDLLCSSSREDWGFTFFGGNLEREVLPIDRGAIARLGEPNELEVATMPLSRARVGDRLCIISLRGNHHTIQHLHRMGFCPGAEVQVVSRSLSGSVVSWLKTSLLEPSAPL